MLSARGWRSRRLSAYRMPVPSTVLSTHDADRCRASLGEETIYGLAGVTTLAHAGDASFLAVATPGVFGPAYFLDLADIIAASGDGPPDPAAIGAVMLRHGLVPAPQAR